MLLILSIILSCLVSASLVIVYFKGGYYWIKTKIYIKYKNKYITSRKRKIDRTELEERHLEYFKKIENGLKHLLNRLKTDSNNMNFLNIRDIKKIKYNKFYFLNDGEQIRINLNERLNILVLEIQYGNNDIKRKLQYIWYILYILEILDQHIDLSPLLVKLKTRDFLFGERLVKDIKKIEEIFKEITLELKRNTLMREKIENNDMKLDNKNNQVIITITEDDKIILSNIEEIEENEEEINL